MTETMEREPHGQLSRRRALQLGLLSAGGLAASGALAACGNDSSSAAGSASGSGAAYKFTFVGAVPGDPFFAAIKNGTDAAAATFGVKVDYQAPRSFPADNIKVIDAAINAKVDGIVLAFWDDKAFNEPMRRAGAAGIPVVLYNGDIPTDFKGTPPPHLNYVGSNEEAAGHLQAQSVIPQLQQGDRCLIGNHGPGQPNIEAHVKGVRDELEAQLGAMVDVLDISGEGSKIVDATRSYLQAHEDTKAIFTMAVTSSTPIVQLLDDKGKAGKILVSTNDLDPQTIAYIKSGKIVSTIDQQPYLQGFIPVMQLFHYKKYLFNPSDYNTGRDVINKDNVERIEALVAKGVR